jgi:hypothetical protein
VVGVGCVMRVWYAPLPVGTATYGNGAATRPQRRNELIVMVITMVRNYCILTTN